MENTSIKEARKKGSLKSPKVWYEAGSCGLTMQGHWI